ncbi:MAG: AMP-dependent synthetase/ligase [Myxococcaceae bacterium]|nr:AMP-dependent synthetase/ligase [Myxococcaceae bacterium]
MELPRTMVHLLAQQAERFEDRPALWTKKGGSYLPTSWREYHRRVRHFASGLMELGLMPRQPVAIMGFNREEWLVADLGAMAAGGVPVGLYTTLSAEQVEYIVGHSEAPFVVLENEQHLERLLTVRARLPKLKEIILMDAPRTPRPGVLSYDEVMRLGEAANESRYHARLASLQPQDLGTLIYTSGTTGNPKGVMLSHKNLTWTGARLSQVVSLSEREVILSYLPLSHIAEQICSIHGPISCGVQVYFAESFEKLPENLKEVRPTVFFGVPRVWEKFKAKAEAGIASQPPARQRLVAWARGVALRWHQLTLDHQNPPLSLDVQYALAKKLVFSKLKARIGMDRAWITATAAAPIGRDVLDFFASVDIVLREVYGQSEDTGPTSVSTPEYTKLGALGRPMNGVEVRIADDGEILVRGENVCLGYYKEPGHTAELIQDGWLHSGDVGELDGEGYLRITGRKKEIIVTSGGKKTAPATIEGYLKALAPVGQALVVGDNRNYLVAVLALDQERVTGFAKAKGWPDTVAALSTHQPFLDELRARIEAEVNPRVARFETIKHFHVLPTEFTIDSGELTSTMKVRRKVCEQKFAAQIEALYALPASAAA